MFLPLGMSPGTCMNSSSTMPFQVSCILRYKLFVYLYTLEPSKELWPNLCSMAKLFDLVVMGVKMHLVVSSELSSPYTVVLTHLRCVRELLVGAESTSESSVLDASVLLLDAFEQRLNATYQFMSCGSWLSVRRTLLSFFEDRRVKVRAYLRGAASAYGKTLALVGQPCSWKTVCITD